MTLKAAYLATNGSACRILGLVQRTLVKSLLLVLAGSCATPPVAEVPQSARYLEASDRAAAWLEAQAIHEDGCVHWKPWRESEEEADSSSLYSGTPGVVFFFLEHFALTASPTSRELAEGGLAWLAERISPLFANEPDGIGGIGLDFDPGLYTGLAGLGATFLAADRALDDPRYRDEAARCVWYLVEALRRHEPGRGWNDSTDVVSGTAGIGFFLLRAAERFDSEAILGVAATAGDLLVEAAVREETGWKWRIADGVSRTYPNFSHGTAGVATFLAALHRATGEPRYLDAALEGARWLDAHATREHGGTAWCHHEPGGEDLFYAGWCHGPAGTARLFRELFAATGDAAWLDRERECAAWLEGCGLLERPLEGCWNVSLCCGSAGIGDFFADLYRATGEARYLEQADRMVDDLLARATPGDPGTKWIQAEHRVRPDLLHAQTGLMQGASGIGLFLLKRHAIEVEGRSASVLALPDSPYGQILRPPETRGEERTPGLPSGPAGNRNQSPPR